LNGELQQQAATLGLTPHITFHGFLTQHRVVDVLRRADLYVQSSLHEAAGVAVLEAAAAGVPAIGTPVGYVADWSPSKAAVVAPTPESLADGILALRAEPDRRHAIASAARAFSITHDADWSAAQFDELYRSMVSV
jgi:glycosyltransferase involved in cell wall biosynthesis